MSRYFTASRPLSPSAEWAEFKQQLHAAGAREYPRSFGFELEAPSIENWLEGLQDTGIDPDTVGEFHPDGSVHGDTENCECECDECVLHECNCDSCERNGSWYDSPEHCRDGYQCAYSGDLQEMSSRSMHGTDSPVIRAMKSCPPENFVSVNDSCGLHIHIGSRNETAKQLAGIQRAYRAIRPELLEAIAGRGFNDYARGITLSDIEATEKQDVLIRPKAVNPSRHFTKMPDEQTVEFRQGAGTTDLRQILAMVHVWQAVYAYGIENRAPFWLARCTTLTDLFRELRITL